MTLPTNNNKKILNVTITGDDVDLLRELQLKLNAELMMNLSMPQVIKRLVRQATEAAK